MEELDNCVTNSTDHLSNEVIHICNPNNVGPLVGHFLGTFLLRVLRHYQGGIELYPNELMTIGGLGGGGLGFPIYMEIVISLKASTIQRCD